MQQSPIHDDFWKIVNSFMPYTQTLILDQSFDPYGVLLHPDGSMDHNTVVFARPEPFIPTIADAIDAQQKALKKKAQMGNVTATAIFYPAIGTPPDKTEEVKAIGIALDHSEGQSIHLVLSYALNGDEFEYGARWYTDGECAIFTNTSGD